MKAVAEWARDKLNFSLWRVESDRGLVFATALYSLGFVMRKVERARIRMEWVCGEGCET